MSAPKSLREAVETLRDELIVAERTMRRPTTSGAYALLVVTTARERMDAILAASPDAPEPVTPPFAGLPDHMHGFAGLPDHWQPTTALPPPASRREETPKTPEPDVVCEHGTAMDVHCCGCHSGFLFDSSKCTCF